ncbi:hypothetical protein ACSL103130_05995 [Actinomyces slackii]|uniref:NACHT domain n=1 Tax=Actinomyces slackii TaxID=52774 RepID=A0A3S4TCZ9_9ACTO|nr:hypothetical protein [Actinomyces slackii]VEG75044.1 Uncharacterised protein [Actinomyces slackii]
MSATAIVSVGLAIVQITLLISGDSGHAALAGGVAGLLDRLPVPKPGKEVRAGERVAEEIAERVPSGEEYRQIEDHQWEAAAQDVAALLRDLPEKKRRNAGYDAEALRKAVLEAGGRERRANLGDEEAKTAFDWLLEEACRQVAELFTDSEALERIIELLGEMSDVLGDIREGMQRGPLVREMMDAHRHKTQMLAPEELKDRETEKADLKKFVHEAPEQWVAYTAPMLSGKTAVMADFALRPPRGVRVVSYFVRRSEASNNHQSFFLSVMTQLAEILGDRYVYSVAQATQLAQSAYLADSLRMATAVCESRGERLVLLVDGLDEDVYFEAPDRDASILSTLPPRLPGQLKVITASRPNPPVPTDVLCEAWKHRIDWELSSSPHAIAEVSPEDIDKFFNHECGLTVGALLAACEGQLTVDNLSALMGRLSDGGNSAALGGFIKRAPGRLLNVMNIGMGRSPIMAYSLGHDVMLRKTLRKLSPDSFGEGDDPEGELFWAGLRDRVLKPYRNTIIHWAETHEWSRNSPSYLLGEGYVSVVQREQGDRGVLELLGVRERNDRIAQRNGSGYGVISLIDECANRYLEGRGSDCEESDIKILLGVAEERQRLTRSFPYIPGLVTVEALSAEGDFEPLRGLILSFEDPSDRERALKGLFRFEGVVRWLVGV